MVEAEKSALAGYLERQHWDAFFTATFARHQTHSATAIQSVIRELHAPRLRPTKTFVAAEQHRLGGWHCHGLLEFPQSKHFGSEIGFAKTTLGKLGFNVVNSVSNLDACSAYLSKYLTKDEFHGDWTMTGRERYWKSG